MIQDLRQGLRSIWAAKLFAAAAMISLAVGIGANTAIFAVVNAVILQPLPFPSPDRLAFVGTTATNLFSVPSFVGLQAAAHSLESLGAYETADFVLSGTGLPLQLRGQRISPEIVSLLGFDDRLRPAHGRMFAPGEFSSAGSRVLLMSDRLWQQRFNRDPAIVGSSVLLDGEPATVIGIIPARFTLFPDADLLLPLGFTPAQLMDRAYRRLELIGRLPANATAEAAQQQLSAALRTANGTSLTGEIDVRLRPLRDVVVADADRTLFTLWAIAGIVLLIGCINFANLVLARTVNRRHEVAVRSALGARPVRIARLLLVESALLAIGGAVVGGALAFGIVRFVLMQQSRLLPRLAEIEFDGTAAGFAAVLALTTAFAFGSIPVWLAARPRPTHVLNDPGAAATGFSLWRHHAGKSVLTLVQIAATLMLLIGAALLAKSYWTIERKTPGYDASSLLAVQFELPSATYGTDRAIQRFAEDLTAKFKQLPGVRFVSAATSLPLLPGPLSFSYLTVEGQTMAASAAPDDLPMGFLPPPPPPPPPGGRLPDGRRPDSFVLAFQSKVGPEFLDAMAIPIQRGRGLTVRDDAMALPVAVVNETMSRRFWKDGDALGKRFRPIGGAPWVTIVGIVGDIRRFSRDDRPRPEFYVPLAQQAGGLRFDNPLSKEMRLVSRLSFAVRTSGPPELMTDLLRREVAAIDPTLAVARLSTMQGVLDEAVAPRRFVLASFVAFAAAALVLAACGTYGVMSYLVQRRTQEFGLRLALGATRRQVMWLALSQGVALAAGGVALGVSAAAAGSRAVQSRLFHVSDADVASYAALAAAMIVVVLIASYLPARRALRVDPMTALRRE